eukprot:TRINITY_DN658_c1_g1_i5.p1 TRINITY_DN658_c1_g1~~TRINITY_DN658_c1_g1_i5.p1  ORF type:complete len:319 (-),score=45.43 TRINITY_DN658_c1_g1_i5:134-1021(-)
MGTHIASGSYDWTVKVWNAQKLIATSLAEATKQQPEIKTNNQIKVTSSVGEEMEQHGGRLEEKEGFSQMKYRGALDFVKDYVPTTPLIDQLVESKAHLNVVKMDLIVKDSTRFMEDLKWTHNKHKLDDDEMLAIVLYTHDLSLNGSSEENFYWILNNVLRTRDPKVMIHWKGYLYHLLKGLSKLPGEELTVYRGGIPMKALEEYSVGRLIHWSRFTSTSTTKLRAVSFCQGKDNLVLLKIQVMSGRMIKEYSLFEEEGEVLLMPNTRLIVSRGLKMKKNLWTVKLVEQGTDNLVF